MIGFMPQTVININLRGGSVEIVSDKILRIETNRNSTNWYAKVGSEENHILIAGCQIHYAVKCDEKPNDGYVRESMYDSKGSTNVILKSDTRKH
ncbi:hypothetical protein [Ornithobacterium rhinotracheale]|uniref:hypothetical protein n=1 Tax=Ornithobacterium rhinotracheale TaxID=28251 RepID=UPI004039F6F2